MSDTTAEAPAVPAASALSPAPVAAAPSDTSPTPPVAPQPLPAADAPKPVIEAPKPDAPKSEEKKAAAPEITGPVGEKFKALAKAEGLDDAKQAKLAEFYNGVQAEAQKTSEAEFAKLDSSWRDALKADPVIGGQNYDASIAAARKGVEWAGGVELARILDSTGLGNHPVLVKAFHKLGKSLAEDSVSGTPSQGSSEPSEADTLAALYPSMFPKH